MSMESERHSLSQKDTLDKLLRHIGSTEFATIYENRHAVEGHCAIYSALVPTKGIVRALAHADWDLVYGGGTPTCLETFGDARSVEYLRFGNEEGIEPLVIDRWFHGIKEDYVEISEEFRLFHNLFHDRQRDEYFKIDNTGNTDLVASVEPNLVKVRMKEIRQFLAIKEMHLAIQFDCAVYSDKTMEELGLAPNEQHFTNELARWSLSYGRAVNSDPRKQTFSRLLGKRLIEPLAKSKSGFFGFAEERDKQYVDFIVGMDDDGNEIVHTCDPESLANFFGKNPEAAHEVAPISFRKQVLEKYYQEPSKYKIADGHLSCGSLWGLRIDNHHDDKVSVLLVDLGRLSYQEQMHWRTYNFASETGYSEVTFRRWFLNEWAESDRPEHAFLDRYKELSNTCRERMGWQILLPLANADEYHLDNLRVPSTDEQKDFDGLVLGLATVLVDSINVNELRKLLPRDRHLDQHGNQIRGIQLLHTVLAANGAADYETHIDFLRALQNLRSSGAAHRKGSEYRKVAGHFAVENSNLRTVFAEILGKAIALADFLIVAAQDGRLVASYEDLTAP